MDYSSGTTDLKMRGSDHHPRRTITPPGRLPLSRFSWPITTDLWGVLFFYAPQVLTHVREAQQMHRRRFDLREIKPGRFEQVQ